MQYAGNSTEANSTEVESGADLSFRKLELFQLYYTPCLVVLGVLGNTLSVFVFFSTKLKKISSSCYLAALAISDTFFLLFLFATWLTLVGLDIYNKPIICESVTYLSSVSSFLSVWLVLAFTAERFLAVGYPFHRQSICKVSRTKRARTVTLILLVIAMIVYSPLLVFAGTSLVSEKIMCGMNEEWRKELHIFNIFDSVVTYVIPVVGIAVLNAFISRNMWVMAKVRRRLTYQGSSQSSSREDSLLKYKRKTTPVSQYKITKMLLMVSTTCLCLNLPSYIMRLLADLADSGVLEVSKEPFIIAQQICLQLFYANFGVDFVLYCISGQNFRKAVRSVFCPRPMRRRETSAMTVSESRTQSTGSSISKKRKAPAPSEVQETINYNIIAMKVF